MKYIITLLFPFTCISNITAQLHIAGNVSIDAGGTMSTIGDVYSESDVLGKGRLLLNGFGAQNLKMDGHLLPLLELDNASGLLLSNNATIGDSLVFTSGKIQLGSSDLVFGTDAKAVGAGNNMYIVTNGTGTVTAQNMAANGSFTFPVGQSDANGDYTPATVTNPGGMRTINVQVKSYAGSQSIVFNPAWGIDRTWQITSDVAGNVLVSLTHNIATEGSFFDRTSAFVTQQQMADGTMWNTGVPSAGTNGGFTHTGTFTIPVGVAEHSYFSKSNDVDSSLGKGEETGISEIAAATFHAVVIPNPFTDNLQLQIISSRKQKIAYTVTDIIGKVLVYDNLDVRSGMSRFVIPVQAVPAGIYFCNLNGENIHASFKVVKQ